MGPVGVRRFHHRGRRGVAIRPWVALGLAVAGLGGVGAAVPATAASAAPAPAPVYDLALGDSLAAGVGAGTTATRYANVLYQHELARFPTLQLVNLACSGATTSSVINGGGCSYASGTQLGDAEAFLRAHPRQVAMVTIDIGANDVDGCLVGGTVNVGCVQSGLTHITTNLPVILAGLASAYPGVAVYGMNYYDPFLGLWLTGPSGQTAAQQSEVLAGTLNTSLAQLYATAGASTADVASAFQTTDFALTGSYLGTPEPQNVADVCNWTLFCSGGGNIHANDIGHGLVAGAFATVLDGVAVSTTVLPEATVGVAYAGALTAVGGHTRYRWTLAAGSTPLPAGLRLHADGTITGRATATGTVTLTVQVADTRLPVAHHPAVHRATGAVSLTVGA
ncbi:MAG TPA: SGNH/GDSL hydrolase family protein [Acidimicrobiales bacterium]